MYPIIENYTIFSFAWLCDVKSLHTVEQHVHQIFVVLLSHRLVIHSIKANFYSKRSTPEWLVTSHMLTRSKHTLHQLCTMINDTEYITWISLNRFFKQSLTENESLLLQCDIHRMKHRINMCIGNDSICKFSLEVKTHDLHINANKGYLRCIQDYLMQYTSYTPLQYAPR